MRDADLFLDLIKTQLLLIQEEAVADCYMMLPENRKN